MQKLVKISRVCGALAVGCLLMVVSLHVAAQDDKPRPEVYQAQAMGQSTQLGKTFNVTINIEQYSSADERQALVDAFTAKGSQGLYNALEKMHAKGRMAITGTLGYDVSFARKIQTADGFQIRVLTNRPIRFGEAWYNGRSMDYNLSFIQLNINDDPGKSTGVLMPAVQFSIDKKTGEVVANNYQNPWKLQNIMNRSSK
jgi:hypothetical protein